MAQLLYYIVQFADAIGYTGKGGKYIAEVFKRGTDGHVPYHAEGTAV